TAWMARGLRRKCRAKSRSCWTSRCRSACNRAHPAPRPEHHFRHIIVATGGVWRCSPTTSVSRPLPGGPGSPLLLLAALACAGLSRAQSLAVYSELQRPDPFGQIVAADRGASPREILSPAAPRNGFVSFHIAVTAPTNTNYFLYIVTSPLNA